MAEGAQRYLCNVPYAWSTWAYLLCFFITAIISWVLRDYGTDGLDFSPLNDCLADPGNATEPVNTSCLGDLAVLRISWGNVLFFAVMAVLLLAVTTQENPRMVVHTGLWVPKLLAWGALCGTAFLMPNGIFEVYGQIARVFSCFYIIFQLVILLDFIYIVNECLLDREWHWAMIIATALLICGSIVGTGFLYKYYAPSGSCSLNIFFITWNLILFLGYAGISVSPWRVQSAGLLTSGAVFAYCTYYVWSALNSQPPGDCANATSGGNKTLNIIAFILTLLSVAYTAWSSSTSSDSFELGGGSSEGQHRLPYRPDFFHLVFLLASAYLVMIFTGWDLSGSEGDWSMDSGWASTWVKIVASWLCALLYAWSMVAHKIFPKRSFY